MDSTMKAYLLERFSVLQYFRSIYLLLPSATLVLFLVSKARTRPPENSYTVPYTIPFLRSTIAFVSDGCKFFQEVK